MYRESGIKRHKNRIPIAENPRVQKLAGLETFMKFLIDNHQMKQ
jgi:hypothetical protein